VVADFDGDGRVDLAVANAHELTKDVPALFNRGRGFAETVAVRALPGIEVKPDLAAGDLDGERDTDLAVALVGSEPWTLRT
jgi:hypothetical protein